MKKFSLMLLMSASIALFSCKSSNTGTGTDPNSNPNQGMRNDNMMQSQDNGTMQDNTGTTRSGTGAGTINTNRSGTSNTGTIGTDDNSRSMDTNRNGSSGTINTGTPNIETSNMGNDTDYGSLQDDMLGKNMEDMYGQLKMTEDQINQYKTVSNKRMDAMKNNGFDRSSLNRETLMKNQDADMEQVLSTEQYTKYQSFVKDYYPNVGGNGLDGTIDNNR